MLLCLLETVRKKRDLETRGLEDAQSTKTGRFQTVTGTICLLILRNSISI